MSTPALRIDAVGPQVTIQDLGRPGHASLGVTEGGAADRLSLRRANRLVGNAEDAAALEILIGGLEVTALTDVTVAVSGAPCRLSHDDEPKETESPLRLRSGDRLRIGTAPVGLRSYLAVAGGVAAPVLLGSRSSSPSMGIGPAPLRDGDVVAVGASPLRAADEPGFGSWRTGALTVEVILGPRHDLFTPESVETLFASAWAVTSDLDRVGVRLDGPALRQQDPSATLASEGVVRGALQVPPTGRPTVFLADHPVTGGYPVIGVVRDADADAIAQLRPSDELRFRRAAPPWR
ncbi:MAG TPA: biotin-dependent carboxyltransferase family protein [Marmoricola sp.]